MASEAQLDALEVLLNEGDPQFNVSMAEDFPTTFVAFLQRVVQAARTKVVALGASDAAAGILSWQNPFGVDILVSLVVDLTTPATGACTADFGTAATPTTSNTLLDGVDLGTAAGVFNSTDDAGTSGKTWRRVAAGEFVTGSMTLGATAGLVGKAHISYRFA